jgi:hypothetical protein
MNNRALPMAPNRLLSILVFLLMLKLFGCKEENSRRNIRDSTSLVNEFMQNIEANRNLTKQMLDTSADERLEDKIMASIYSKLNPELNNAKNVLPTLSNERQAVYYIHELEGEVNNGGFDQYYLNNFINSDGLYMFNKTTEALKLISAMKFAALVQRANEVFKANEKGFAEKEGLFDELDVQFYDTYEQENLAELRIKFIRYNIGAFVDK